MLYFNVTLEDFTKLPEGVTIKLNGKPRKLYVVEGSPRDLIRWEEDGTIQEREIYDITFGTVVGTCVAISAVELGGEPPIVIRPKV